MVVTMSVYIRESKVSQSSGKKRKEQKPENQCLDQENLIAFGEVLVHGVKIYGVILYTLVVLSSNTTVI